MTATAPQYAGQPVILTHFGMDKAPHLTVCSGQPFYPPRVGSYPAVPAVPCPLCLHFIDIGKGARRESPTDR